MTKRRIVIATRESPLALKQTELVKAALQKNYPNLEVEFLGLTTQGDKIQGVPLRDLGGKGLFVKELEEALFDKRADIAVHSMKDVPMDLPDGLTIPVICKREEPRDVFVSNQYQSLAELPRNAVVGTSSLRRQIQIHALRSDLTLRDLRGNVNTRLRKLDDNEYSAIILAAAGLKRMNLQDRIRAYLSIDESLPAAGQGALGIECRSDDEQTQQIIAVLNDPETFACVTAERATCRRLQGGCQVPIAAYAHIQKNTLSLKALVADPKGTRILRAREAGQVNQAEKIGDQVANDLIQQGAENLLREFREKTNRP